MSAERDGHRVSDVLTEARTVLSRAETARARLERVGRSDPAYEGILTALERTIVALGPFRRIGRRTAR
ncbi:MULTISPECIES: hypothetical protein [Bacteria]|uniref:hypothetical protein n=1 Tax=Bacteria TaxID=2 RepID=UPI003C7C6D9B